MWTAFYERWDPVFVVGLLLGFVYVAGTFFLLKRDTCVPTYRDSECSLLSWGEG